LANAKQRQWCDRDQCYLAETLVWFIRKGDTVKEKRPIEIEFGCFHLVSQGKPATVSVDIFCNEKDEAPIHKNRQTKRLLTLKADISDMSQTDLDNTVAVMKDGKKYYCIDCVAEATFDSASTKYVLLCQGKRYRSVTAEYA